MKSRAAKLSLKLLPMQRRDFFAGLFAAMEGLPVTIRLLDPPLHEFLPKREDLMVDNARFPATSIRRSRRKCRKSTAFRWAN